MRKFLRGTNPCLLLYPHRRTSFPEVTVILGLLIIRVHPWVFVAVLPPKIQKPVFIRLDGIFSSG